MQMKMTLLIDLEPEEDVWPDYPCPNCGHTPVLERDVCQICGCEGIVLEI